jgi:hypothetical protein
MDGHVEYKGADQLEPVDDENDLKTAARSAVDAESEVYSEAEQVFDFEEAPPAAPGSEEESPDLVPPSQSQAGYRLPEEEVNVPAEPEHFVSGGVKEEVSPDDHTILPPQESTTFNFDTPPEGPESEATPPPPVYVSAASLNSPDLSDIAAFGNSEMSGGRDGTLRYNLIIEGIDTADVREAFREAITDRKFVWDIDQILRSVRNGKVQIQNVAPTKGYMLVTRLRGLPLKIRWEQYAIQQT